MNTLLYFILCSVAFYYLFKFGMRLLLPYAMRKITERMMKKAQQSGNTTYTYYSTGNPFGQYQQKGQSQAQPDGKVRVDYVPQREERRKGTATAGEFIDFEEVK